jgi:hypothetical protein
MSFLSVSSKKARHSCGKVHNENKNNSTQNLRRIFPVEILEVLPGER